MRVLTMIPPLLLLSATLASAAPPQVPISACGDTVPRKAVGYLTTDLDCTGFTGTPGAVMVSKGAALELRGHTITGALFGVVCGELRPRPDLPPALYVEGKCRIDGGGGSVLASEAHGILGLRTTVRNLTIDGAGQLGISGLGPTKLEHVTVTNSSKFGVSIDGSVRLVDATVTGNHGGIGAHSIRIFGSTATGNDIDASCSGSLFQIACADLVARHRPAVRDTQCGLSSAPYDVRPPHTWGVCTLD